MRFLRENERCILIGPRSSADEEQLLVASRLVLVDVVQQQRRPALAPEHAHQLPHAPVDAHDVTLHQRDADACQQQHVAASTGAFRQKRTTAATAGDVSVAATRAWRQQQ